MLTFNTTNLILKNVKNANRMPFEFKGVSNFEENISIELIAGCGCTSVTLKIKSDLPNIEWVSSSTLKPSQEFIIEGNLSSRKKTGKHTKSITVKAKNKKLLSEYKLLFTMYII